MSDAWLTPVTIRPVGVVISPLRNFDQIPNYTEESTIVMRGDLVPGLTGLEHFSHIHVLYHQHRREEWKFRAGIPEGAEAMTLPSAGEPISRGIYTSRAPSRPSAIGSCIVELLSREENRLRVRGLDAVDGTPVLDIKIYLPRYDCFPYAVAPLHWCQKHALIDTSRLLHWETMSVSLTLGMRAGHRALKELGEHNPGALKANVAGSNFFAQGVEGVTGCSGLRGSLIFAEKNKSVTDWFVRVETPGRQVTLRINDRPWASADEVLSATDEDLFAAVEADGVGSIA
jgi:tRNA-Thr(GGU) m(6)t(6)A37 methyltransferase TsaA